MVLPRIIQVDHLVYKITWAIIPPVKVDWQVKLLVDLGHLVGLVRLVVVLVHRQSLCPPGYLV
jgi:hypothetical protein